MPRARNIKYSFFQNDDIAELEPIERLLFVGLWTLVDFNGNGHYRPKRIKAQLFPYDEIDVDQAFDNLERVGLVMRYGQDRGKTGARPGQGQTLFNVVNFAKHQAPHIKEKRAGTDIQQPGENALESLGKMRQHIEKQQDPDKTGTNPDPDPVEVGAAPADSGFLIPDSCMEQENEKAAEKPKRNGKKTAIKTKPRKTRTDIPDDFEPDEKLIAWAKENAPLIGNIKTETEKFRNYHKSIGNQFSDHVAAWRNWMLKAQEINERDAGNGKAIKTGRPEHLRIPFNDDDLEPWARRHEYPSAKPGEQYPQYRKRLHSEVEKRVNA